MTRTLRNRDHPAPNPVSSYPVAPDYFNDPERNDKDWQAQTWREFKEAHPYKPGDVVWMQYGGETRKAFISDIFMEMGFDGWPRAKYRVHVANAKGDRFAKNWIYTWPGFIQRGYQHNGLTIGTNTPI